MGDKSKHHENKMWTEIGNNGGHKPSDLSGRSNAVVRQAMRK